VVFCGLAVFCFAVVVGVLLLVDYGCHLFDVNILAAACCWCWCWCCLVCVIRVIDVAAAAAAGIGGGIAFLSFSLVLCLV
jgi:hypothetical protein